MNFDLSEEQKLLRESVRKLLSEKVSYDDLRTFIDGGNAYDKNLWHVAGEMGWLGTAIPEEYGGYGLGGLELCVIVEELGRSVAPIPFSSSIVLAAEAIKLAGSAEQKARWLPKLATGEVIGTFAYAEGSRFPITSRLEAVIDNGRLSGTKSPVPDAAVADFAIVVAQDPDDQPKLCVVDLKQSGVNIEPVATFDELRKHARITFRDVTAEVLAGDGAYVPVLNALFDRAATFVAFEQVGGADACLEMARDYALERFTFGRPIGGYQAVKHRLADMFVNTELARSNCLYAGWAFDHGTDDGALAAASARISATEAFEFAARENMQLHGGIGYTWEADCHFYYRRERLLALSLGTRADWSNRLTRLLGARHAA